MWILNEVLSRRSLGWDFHQLIKVTSSNSRVQLPAGEKCNQRFINSRTSAGLLNLTQRARFQGLGRLLQNESFLVYLVISLIQSKTKSRHVIIPEKNETTYLCLKPRLLKNERNIWAEEFIELFSLQRMMDDHTWNKWITPEIKCPPTSEVPEGFNEQETETFTEKRFKSPASTS